MTFRSDEQRRAVFAQMQAPGIVTRTRRKGYMTRGGAVVSAVLGVKGLGHAARANRMTRWANLHSYMSRNPYNSMDSMLRKTISFRKAASKDRKIATALGIGSLLTAGTVYRTRNR